MDLARLSFTFSDGRRVEVSESTWEASAVRAKIEEGARIQKDQLNGSGDPAFFFFVETFYSYLASCSSGDVPGAEEAYTLPDVDLDGWYTALVSANPDSFLKVDRSARGEVSFRDGLKLEIISAYLPSVITRRARMEEEALKKEEDRKNPKDIFGVYLYPVLASCSLGPLPPPEEIRSTWPETEIYKWRDAVAEINPHLFGEQSRPGDNKAMEKKKERRPGRSPHGSASSSKTPETTSPRP